jgi:hypothetical protein
MMLIVQEQFLQMPDNVVANESKDQEYWSVSLNLVIISTRIPHLVCSILTQPNRSMLFSADPNNNFTSTPNFTFPSF